MGQSTDRVNDRVWTGNGVRVHRELDSRPSLEMAVHGLRSKNIDSVDQPWKLADRARPPQVGAPLRLTLRLPTKVHGAS